MKKIYFSRKIHLFGIFTLLLLFSGLPVSAQQVYAEHHSSSANGNTNFNHRVDENNYTKVVDENGIQVFQKNQSITQNTQQFEDATANVALTINFIFDDSQYFVPTVMIYDETGYTHTTTYQDFTNPLIVSVPAGTYDILTAFQPINSGKTHIVLKEQQSVQGSTTIQSNISDAVNYVSTTAYNENGEILEPEAGAGGYLFFQRLFYFNPINSVPFGDYYFMVDSFGGQDPDWNFYINDVSNRYSFIQTLKGDGFSLGTYFSKFVTFTGIQGPVSIENDPAGWVYHTEQFQPTQVADSQVAPAYYTASTFNGLLLNGWATSAGGTINPGDKPFRGFLNNPIDGDPADFWVVPAIIDRYVSNSPTTGGTSYFTKGSPVFSDGNGGVLYGSGDVSFNYHSDPLYETKPFLGDDYYRIETSEIKLLPFHPKFSFDNTSAPAAILANNVPITVTGFKGNKFKTSNRGRYGETRESDYLATQIVVKQNGNVIFSGTYEDFETFSIPGGETEIVLTSANTLVDGLQGTNTTTISYTVGDSDAPPTLQQLQFRNSDDQVTSVFDSNIGATLRLSAGDFKYNVLNGSKGYYSYQEGNNVALSYSEHNQNDWVALALTEYPDYFQMPAFGNYYEASLGGITNTDNNVWYDVKVICTDASGNKQEQVISPAFKINVPLGVEDVIASSFSAYPNPFSEQLNITIPEDVVGSYTFKITDLLGRTVYTNNQIEKSFTWNSSFLSSGIYILSIDNNGKSITKKVIKI